MRTKLAAALALLTCSLLAQESKPALQSPQQAPTVSRIVPLKKAYSNAVAALLRPLPVSITSDGNMRFVVVTGSEANVAQAEQAIRQLDQQVAMDTAPNAPNVELTIHVIGAGSSGNNVPAALEPVVQQLRSTFTYAGYQLLDTIFVRGRSEDLTETTGSLAAIAPVPQGATVAPPSTYQLSTRMTVNGEGKTRSVRLGGPFRFGTKQPYATSLGNGTQWQYQDLGINTTADIREGQRVVLGKLTANGSQNALFLVVSARVVD